MAKPKSPTPPPRFSPGARVRVKSGVTVPDFEDIPLGGWTGTIRQVEQTEGQTLYEIAWDQRTLSSIHPVVFKRCERDGLEAEIMWLADEDIEPDDGTPVPIEQPTAILTPPLAMDDEDDRVRAVFGLTHDDPLPPVNEANQHIYYRYLLAHLTLPFRAQYRRKTGPYSSKRVRLTVTGLEDVNEYAVEECYGLIGTGKEPGGPVEFPLIEIEDIEDETNRRLIEDYAYWLANYQ